VSLVLVAAALTKVPAEHTLADVQLAALLPLLNWPAAHGVHTRSSLAEGRLDTKVPAGQVLQGAQEGALSTVENCSVPQAVQLRSLVVVPSLATKVPAGQVDLATQTVAGLPS
jgi:hypothetical protein